MPRVTCACITYGRPKLLNEAVKSFIDQDYIGDSELIILNDQPEIKYRINTSKLPKNKTIKIINVATRYKTVGEKRNACVNFGSGDIMLPWDDDDIHLPWRVSVTVSNMKNLSHWKPNRCWILNNNNFKNNSPCPIEAPSMGGYSTALFTLLKGYDQIQSGQDQTLDKKFKKMGKWECSSIKDEEVFYIYRLAGTGSYHLSAHGFGNGYSQANSKIDKNIKGDIEITPCYSMDYISATKNLLAGAMNV